MIITEKIGKAHFSASEKIIIDYISSLGLKIEKRSANQIAKENDMYRQDYCGCIYSYNSRNKKHKGDLYE